MSVIFSNSGTSVGTHPTTVKTMKKSPDRKKGAKKRMGYLRNCQNLQNKKNFNTVRET